MEARNDDGIPRGYRVTTHSLKNTRFPPGLPRSGSQLTSYSVSRSSRFALRSGLTGRKQREPPPTAGQVNRLVRHRGSGRFEIYDLRFEMKRRRIANRDFCILFKSQISNWLPGFKLARDERWDSNQHANTLNRYWLRVKLTG